MASSDESVHFVGENYPDEDPSEATLKMTGFQSVGPSSSRRRSHRQAATTFRHLLDEEDEVGGVVEEASSPGEEENVVMDMVAEPSPCMV
ncbi:UNVERIFIED_CONTAM: hypothetical protein Slati_3456100 [Sesamum latifolium]|uniref:Uncharacterized protein n=1 Tax=Sesamum latifolium TaxID=2727402 RepID=A0AAW2UHV0_9LAMI